MCARILPGDANHLKPMEKKTFLCHLDELADPGSRGFSVEIEDRPQEIMVIRRGNRVFGYINSCPHTGVCLDWQPGQFLNLDNTLVVCAMHGAEFRIDDGYCIGGPCAGDALTAVPLGMDGENIYIKNG